MTGIPATRTRIYRPPGLPVLGTVAALTGWSDIALRSITLALAAVTVAAVWLLGRVVFGPATGLLAAAASAAAPAVLASVWTFRNDIAAAGLLIAAMAVIWHQLEVRPSPDRRLLVAPLLMAGAFYLRYGATIFIVAVGAVALVLWWRQAIRQWRLVSLGAAAGGLLVLPHFVASQISTGSPLGILVDARRVAHPGPPLPTARDYLGQLVDGSLAGHVGVVLVLLGVVGGLAVLVAAVRVPAWRPRARAVTWVALPGLLAAATLLGSAPATVRFTIYPLLLSLVLGAAAVMAIVRSLGTRVANPRAPQLIAAGLGVLIAASATLYTIASARSFESVRGNQGWIRDAGAALAADAGGSCAVVAAFNMAVLVNWYSGCPSMDPAREDELVGRWLGRGRAEYMLVTYLDSSPETASEERVFAAYRERAIEPPVATYMRRNGQWAATLYRLRP